jgi:DNA-binding LytR/AlgR family response regulator
VHIPADDIIYLESENRVIHLKTESEHHEYYGVLDKEEIKLPESGFFVRIHKSFIINLDHVATFTTKEVVMKDGRSFLVSEKYRDNVKSAYMRYRGNTWKL